MRHDETVLPVAGSLVRVYRAGAGPELVLLHGGGADDARRAWEPVWTALTGHARVTAPDLPGYGGTPLGTTVPTIAGYSAWLAAFLDSCAHGPAGIAGLSLGGRIALRAALTMPDRVTRLALCGVSPRTLARAAFHAGPGTFARAFTAGPPPRLGCPVLLLFGGCGARVRPADACVAQKLVTFLTT
ncbi:alpha/beta fold hydrolase [Nonomuraea sp. NPDC050404]|uniref:alpha/beta fold hydrolase n=1 Tax=Nonomuraea sp. NPDC050404 TaxID=3155783 RepID=UPI0033E936A7